MQIQTFQPIKADEINRWLQENPRIEIKGFSVAAGADTADQGHPLSICAILYEPPAAPADVARAALAEADALIGRVAEEQTERPAPPIPRVIEDTSETD